MVTLESLRQFRINGYALFDLGISFLGMYLVAPLLSKIFLKFRIHIPKKNWLYLTLPLSVFIHLLFGQTTLMTKNFMNPTDHFGLKFMLLALVFFGLRGITLLPKGKTSV